RVVTTQDASANLGLRLIGTVPSMPRLIERPDGSSTVRAALWRSMLTEHVDAARTMLVHSLNTQKSGRSILITSAFPGEGKTMLACHLADSLARAGFKTLLIDGDMRRPSAHRMLNTARTPGLCELLR